MSEALDAGAFARLMARFEPFEPRPVLAAAVSGGADSLALAGLAAGWAAMRGGSVVALTVDHGLRPDSGAEARGVGGWLVARGIAHHILVWAGPKPAAGVQAAARAARRDLLGDWCAANGVLHLLLAHHRGDQAETVALRAEDASGPDGLAAMAAEAPTPWGRVLRPLLAVPKPALTARLAADAQPWIEDPTNRDERHARVRLRAEIAAAGTEPALAAEARRRGHARGGREEAVARALAGLARLAPGGWAWLSASIGDLADDLAAAALGRVLVTVGNLDYRPRGDRLERLLGHLRGARTARTLGGCRIVPVGGGWLVAREPAALPGPEPFGGPTAAWDRFAVTLPPGVDRAGLVLGPLGDTRPPGSEAVPAPARPGLPAVLDLDGAVAVPHFGWVRPGADPRLSEISARFVPRQSLAQAQFTVA